MKKFVRILIVIAVMIAMMVDVYITMENYWTETCTDPNCPVCHPENADK